MRASILFFAVLFAFARSARVLQKMPLLPAFEYAPLEKRQDELSGPEATCQDPTLCPCGTNDMCCPQSYMCCAVGHKDRAEAAALGWSSGTSYCESAKNLRANGFVNGTSCAPPSGACCEDGHACSSNQECCHSQCIPAGTVCCPKTSSGEFGYCLAGLKCGEESDVCVETANAGASLVASPALLLALAIAALGLVR